MAEGAQRLAPLRRAALAAPRHPKKITFFADAERYLSGAAYG